MKAPKKLVELLRSRPDKSLSELEQEELWLYEQIAELQKKAQEIDRQDISWILDAAKLSVLSTALQTCNFPALNKHNFN